jgi:hypothetical protein
LREKRPAHTQRPPKPIAVKKEGQAEGVTNEAPFTAVGLAAPPAELTPTA